MLRNALSAEPLKKKKRLDPLIEQTRAKRKIRRIEKEIKRFGRQVRPLKPVPEIEGDRQLMKQIDERARSPPTLSEDEIDQRDVLLKDWSRYQSQLAVREQQYFQRSVRAQRRALDWLYATDKELYKAAIRSNEFHADPQTTDKASFLPFNFSGPYFTAPTMHSDVLDGSGSYDPPDGETVDTTTAFQYDFDIDKQFLADPRSKK